MEDIGVSLVGELGSGSVHVQDLGSRDHHCASEAAVEFSLSAAHDSLPGFAGGIPQGDTADEFPLHSLNHVVCHRPNVLVDPFKSSGDHGIDRCHSKLICDDVEMGGR